MARACAPYAGAIRRAVHRHWGPWRLPQAWMAQLYQESRCDPAAVSPAGARGLAQFMPATWAEMARRLDLPAGATPHDAIAIEAGAAYQARLMRQWDRGRDFAGRWPLGLASYNAGLGHILGAQAHCDDALLWRDVAPCLARVTGRHADETRTYVRRTAHWWRTLGACRPAAAPGSVQTLLGCKAARIAPDHPDDEGAPR
ncbi:transglycosylase SLT domain-containing protein [Rhodothalassium salexigens]|nr:transglycosylase SLT domain-containing protein [Rhodothalassium salexigens]MBB4211699.1 soluble lytic murein transglycosylase-like protein [Rhodothalassium salexigens DSM 2132]